MKRFLVLYFMLLTLLVACFASCSSTQRITVKQEQEGQIQETVIESDTRVRDFSMTITRDRIEYNGSVFRPERSKRKLTAATERGHAIPMDTAEIRQGYRG